MANVILQVPDLSCGHCEKTVRAALEGQPGINSVQVDLPAKRVYLGYDNSTISLDRVSEILDEEGYPVQGSEVGVPPASKRGFIPLAAK